MMGWWRGIGRVIIGIGRVIIGIGRAIIGRDQTPSHGALLIRVSSRMLSLASTMRIEPRRALERCRVAALYPITVRTLISKFAEARRAPRSGRHVNSDHET